MAMPIRIRISVGPGPGCRVGMLRAYRRISNRLPPNIAAIQYPPMKHKMTPMKHKMMPNMV